MEILAQMSWVAVAEIAAGVLLAGASILGIAFVVWIIAEFDYL